MTKEKFTFKLEQKPVVKKIKQKPDGSRFKQILFCNWIIKLAFFVSVPFVKSKLFTRKCCLIGKLLGTRMCETNLYSNRVYRNEFVKNVNSWNISRNCQSMQSLKTNPGKIPLQELLKNWRPAKRFFCFV